MDEFDQLAEIAEHAGAGIAVEIRPHRAHREAKLGEHLLQFEHLRRRPVRERKEAMAVGLRGQRLAAAGQKQPCAFQRIGRIGLDRVERTQQARRQWMAQIVMDDVERQLFARGGLAQKRNAPLVGIDNGDAPGKIVLAQRAAQQADRDRHRIVVAEQQHALALQRAVLQHQQRAAHRGVGHAGRLVQRDVDRRRAGDDLRQPLDLGFERIRDDDAMPGADSAGDVELRGPHAEIALDEIAAVAGQRQPLLAFEQAGLFQLAAHRARHRQRQPRLARGILQAQRAGAVDRAQQRLDTGGSLAQTRRLRYQVQNRRRGHYCLISLAIRLTSTHLHQLRVGPAFGSVLAKGAYRC